MTFRRCELHRRESSDRTTYSIKPGGANKVRWGRLPVRIGEIRITREGTCVGRRLGMKRRLGLRMTELGLKLVMSRLRRTLARKSWFLRVSFITLVSRLVRKGQLVDDFQY